MDRDLDRQEYETWDRVLTNVVPHDHIVQLYQDEWCRRTRFPRRTEGREHARDEFLKSLPPWIGSLDRVVGHSPPTLRLRNERLPEHGLCVQPSNITT